MKYDLREYFLEFMLIFCLVMAAIILYARFAGAGELKRVDIPDESEIMLCWDTKTLFIIPTQKCKVVKTIDLLAFADEIGKDPEPKKTPKPEASPGIPTPAE